MYLCVKYVILQCEMPKSTAKAAKAQCRRRMPDNKNNTLGIEAKAIALVKVFFLAYAAQNK